MPVTVNVDIVHLHLINFAYLLCLLRVQPFGRLNLVTNCPRIFSFRGNLYLTGTSFISPPRLVRSCPGIIINSFIMLYDVVLEKVYGIFIVYLKGCHAIPATAPSSYLSTENEPRATPKRCRGCSYLTRRNLGINFLFSAVKLWTFGDLVISRRRLLLRRVELLLIWWLLWPNVRLVSPVKLTNWKSKIGSPRMETFQEREIKEQRSLCGSIIKRTAICVPPILDGHNP